MSMLVYVVTVTVTVRVAADVCACVCEGGGGSGRVDDFPRRVLCAGTAWGWYLMLGVVPIMQYAGCDSVWRVCAARR